MGILRKLPHTLHRFLSATPPSDTLYMGHRCRLKKVSEAGKQSKYIRFPVSLAVQQGEELPVIYEDFSLNLLQGSAFIETEAPLPEGSDVVLHFYIPPEKKLLAEFRGVVTAENSDSHHPHGMDIRLDAGTSDSLQILGDYLDEHRHLLDATG